MGNGRNAERSKLEKWVGLQIRLLALIRIVMEKNKGETNHSSAVWSLVHEFPLDANERS